MPKVTPVHRKGPVGFACLVSVGAFIGALAAVYIIAVSKPHSYMSGPHVSIKQILTAGVVSLITACLAYLYFRRWQNGSPDPEQSKTVPTLK